MIILMFFAYRYGGGMSSAKAALESDTRVGFSLC
jgi:hypothetical protein